MPGSDAAAPVEPDDGREVPHLLWGEVVDRARDLAIDLAGVKHQHLVFTLGGLGAVKNHTVGTVRVKKLERMEMITSTSPVSTIPSAPPSRCARR